MAEPFLGEVRIMSFGYPPKGWSLCDGQLLQINVNQALFSILGTTYGGDGRTTFALPNLQGRAPVHVGAHVLGESGGADQVTLTSDQTFHGHALYASADFANSASPANNVLAAKTRFGPPVYAAANHLTALRSDAVSNAGGSQPYNNLQLYLTLNFVIATQGIFPTRN